MNVLPFEKQILIASMLCKGNSIRGIERITGVHRDTIMRFGLRISPIMESGVTNHLWNWEDSLGINKRYNWVT